MDLHHVKKKFFLIKQGFGLNIQCAVSKSEIFRIHLLTEEEMLIVGVAHGHVEICKGNGE